MSAFSRESFRLSGLGLVFGLLSLPAWATTYNLDFNYNADARQDAQFGIVVLARDPSTLQDYNTPCALNNVQVTTNLGGSIVFTSNKSSSIKLTVPITGQFPVRASTSNLAQVSPWIGTSGNYSGNSSKLMPTFGAYSALYYGPPTDSGGVSSNVCANNSTQTSTRKNHYNSGIGGNWSVSDTPKLGVTLRLSTLSAADLQNGGTTEWTANFSPTGQYGLQYYNDPRDPGSYTSISGSNLPANTYKLTIKVTAPSRILTSDPPAGDLASSSSGLFSASGYLQKICLYDGTGDGSAGGALQVRVDNNMTNNSSSNFALAPNGQAGTPASQLLYFSLTGASPINQGVVINRAQTYSYRNYSAYEATYDPSTGGNLTGLPASFNCVPWNLRLKAAPQGKAPGTYGGQLNLTLSSAP
ncbi:MULTISPECIES: CfaE/CblD family pilus tip adhesin [unclassified Paludibacterium]|uniref:CfaE/CblD family pilus tip adhesin n=1 Tax=unclassified Paludibacterium TaxID=2618429 RepID=UPI001C051067|nr:CfaE/CblD family pilus tip adhesin [Paludibacterium sp. B53371]BEV70741.1 hypothetical protein THUN1379_02230 [Paludibacterium sp. THUN1379]